MSNMTQEDLIEASQGSQGMMPQGIIPNLIRAQEDIGQLASLSRLLLEYSEMLELLRREFRGEEYIEFEGKEVLVQTTKPVFVKTDPITKQPIMKESKYIVDRMEYIPHDDAIEELVATLRMTGINKITPITNLNENEILGDLRAILCKLAATMMLKQIEWGLDKELMPLKIEQIKTIIKDARMVAKEGQLLRAIRSSVTRVEQQIEGTRNVPKQQLYS